VTIAALSEGAFLGVVGGYLLLALILFLIWPRDLSGRRRATGCILGLVIFFGLFVVAFAAWASDHVF
jgi:hypothetical protein